MSAKENFRMNLQSVMDRNGISQYQLSKATCISRPYINKVLLGKTNPTLPYCEKLADGVRVPLQTLVVDTTSCIRQLDELERERVRGNLPLSKESPKPARRKRNCANETAELEHQPMRIWVRKLLS